MNNQESITTSLKTIIEMLNDRGIEIDLQPDVIHGILSSNINKNIFEVILNNIKIIYYLNAKFKWSEIKKVFEINEKYDLYMLIVRDKISSNNIKSINALNIPIQIFDIKELQYNITKHVLVPKHVLVKDMTEIQQILEKYSLKTKFQLPIILKTDPVARYYNLKNGDIVKIVRNSPSSGEYVVYRCCL
jgi:DNA-directed RNA polymerase I, II, and III subunit RPABC1